MSFSEKLQFNSKNQTQIKTELLDLIKTSKYSGTFISQISKSPHRNISIYNSEGSSASALRRVVIEDILNKKEIKISKYASDKFEEIWVLMVLGGQASSDYSFIEESIMNIHFSTSFDKVFLLNFSTSELFQLSTVKP